MAMCFVTFNDVKLRGLLGVVAFSISTIYRMLAQQYDDGCEVNP